jgi:ribosomal protein S18 acetylase RimI-like enzyme
VFDVRRLGPGDEKAAGEVATAFYDAGGINAAFLADGRNYLLAAYVEGAVAGFLVAYELPRLERGEPMTYLHRLDVLPEFHRRGVGWALVEKVKALAAERGSFKMFVITSRANDAATALYEATGARMIPAADAVFEYRENEEE